MLELIAERAAAPRDDMVSGLVEARVDGGRLSDDEIVSTVVVLLNAGHEATVNTLGNGVTALLRNPPSGSGSSTARCPRRPRPRS